MKRKALKISAKNDVTLSLKWLVAFLCPWLLVFSGTEGNNAKQGYSNYGKTL